MQSRVDHGKHSFPVEKFDRVRSLPIQTKIFVVVINGRKGTSFVWNTVISFTLLVCRGVENTPSVASIIWKMYNLSRIGAFSTPPHMTFLRTFELRHRRNNNAWGYRGRRTIWKRSRRNYFRFRNNFASHHTRSKTGIKPTNHRRTYPHSDELRPFLKTVTSSGKHLGATNNNNVDHYLPPHAD